MARTIKRQKHIIMQRYMNNWERQELEKLYKSIKEMSEHAESAGTVIDCGSCKNNGCQVCKNS